MSSRGEGRQRERESGEGFLKLSLFFSLSRMPIRGKNRSSAMSLRSFSVASGSVLSSEEGEVSEYPGSKRSTLESCPGTRLAGSEH